MLDQLGDLYLLGYNLIGEVSAYKPGHALNHQLVKTLLATPDAYLIEQLDTETSGYSWLNN
jgi:UDP-3-O-[3-hydroxymyristoyl] N-acetylglucosamine deacetylase